MEDEIRDLNYNYYILCNKRIAMYSIWISKGFIEANKDCINRLLYWHKERYKTMKYLGL